MRTSSTGVRVPKRWTQPGKFAGIVAVSVPVCPKKRKRSVIPSAIMRLLLVAVTALALIALTACGGASPELEQARTTFTAICQDAGEDPAACDEAFNAMVDELGEEEAISAIAAIGTLSPLGEELDELNDLP